MTTPQDLSQTLYENRMELNKFYQILPITELESYSLPNGWSVKDLMGILAAWERLVAEHLAQNSLNALDEVDINEYDYEIYKERQDWMWTEVEEEASLAFAALRQAVENIRIDADVAVLADAIAPFTLNRYRKYAPILERYAKQYRQSRRR